MLHFRIASIALTVGLAFGAAQAGAATVTLPLGNLHTGAAIGTYFSGGHDSVPNDGTGPNLGLVFSSNATAQSEAGAGKFENNPSGQKEVLYFSASNTTTAYMDDGGGFYGLSFNYSLSNNTGAPGFAYVYSGLNGTGTLLDTLTLAPATSNVQACGSRLDAYCTWQTISTGTLSGKAESVVFSGAAAGLGSSTTTPTSLTEFDALSFATTPLPASVWLLVSSLGGLVGFSKLRRNPAV